MSKLGWGVVWAVVAAGPAYGAGNGTHVEMGRRAVDCYFDRVDEMLPGLSDLFGSDELRRVFYCGCMFPDWGFGGAHADAAEASHWYPFQRAYFEYLKERHPWPWDEEAKRQIVFFLGALTHAVSDIPWHFSKEGHKSFLSMARENDRLSHGDCEIAVDVFAHVEHPIRPAAGGKAWWPYEQLLEVFQRQGLVVPRAGLEKGCKDLLITFNLGVRMSNLVYEGLKRRGPWTHRHYKDYCFGGVDHAAALSSMWIKHAYARLRGWRCYQNSPGYVESFPRRAAEAVVSDRQHVGSDTAGQRQIGPFLELTGDGGEDRRSATIRFGLGDLAAKTPIRKATLWLHFAGRSSGEQNLEQTIEAYMKTRNRRRERAVSRLVVRPYDPAGHWRDWDVTEAVQIWVDHPDQNHGLHLKETEDSRQGKGVLRFYSSEAYELSSDGYDGGKAVALRPVLVVMPE